MLVSSVNFLRNMLMTFRSNMVARACLCVRVFVCACVTWSRPKAPESTFLLSFLIFTSWKGQSWKPNTCVKGYSTAVQRYYRSLFFVCALSSSFILTSGLSSQNGRTSVFLLSVEFRRIDPLWHRGQNTRVSSYGDPHKDWRRLHAFLPDTDFRPYSNFLRLRSP